MSSVMDDRSNWLFWQVPPCGFVRTAGTANCNFSAAKERPCNQSWVGGWCCDREVLKGRDSGIRSTELMDFRDLYECQLPVWEDHVADFSQLMGLPGYLGDRWAFQVWCYCLSESSQQRNVKGKGYFLLIVFSRSCECLCKSVITRVDLSGNSFETPETWKQEDGWFFCAYYLSSKHSSVKLLSLNLHSTQSLLSKYST